MRRPAHRHGYAIMHVGTYGANMDQLLSLFPLGATVLFPGAQISLHIFEERYRLMISRCIALKEHFGIVLIREGEEVGETADPFDVGTIAKITQAIRSADGQMYITVEGHTRFRIEGTVQTAPYLVAMVHPLEDQIMPEHEIQAAELRELYDRYRGSVAAATGVDARAGGSARRSAGDFVSAFVADPGAASIQAATPRSRS